MTRSGSTRRAGGGRGLLAWSAGSAGSLLFGLVLALLTAGLPSAEAQSGDLLAHALREAASTAGRSVSGSRAGLSDLPGPLWGAGQQALPDGAFVAAVAPLTGGWQLARGAPRERSVGRRGIGSADAILTALMSALLPGAGQIRNGSILRGLAYLALEVGGWTAYLSFGQGADDRLAEASRFAKGYWDSTRYEQRAQLPDSCASCGCPDGEAFSRDLALIKEAQAGNHTRFLEYVGRDAYGCGWSSPTSRSIYAGLWGDREDMQGAQRWAGRLIFLNHLVAAVDAFLEARSLRLQLDEHTDVKFDVRGLPLDVRPEVCITRRF